MTLAPFLTLLSEHPVLVLFLVTGIGAAIGRIRLWGMSLGAVAVLFTMIALTAWGVSQGVVIEVPAYVGDFGLVLFAFSIGVIAGPGFVNALRTSYWMLLLVSAIMIAAAALTLWLGWMLDLSPETIAGAYAGSVTSTPALAATGGSPAATVGYASTYIFGVVGAMGAVVLALRHSRTDTDAPPRIVDLVVRIDTDSNPTMTDLTRRHGGRVLVSRLRRPDGEVIVVGPDTVLEKGSIINIVGPERVVAAVTDQLGHPSTLNITHDRSRLDYRRIILSDSRWSGRTIAQLGVAERFGATIVRVRRGDVEFLGTPDFVLHQGDRLRVVAPRDQLPAVTAFLGDSERGMADLNPVALGLGIAAGMLLGLIEVPLPGGSHLSLGAAAGALIVGLVMGRIGRIGRFVTTIPNAAATALGELGLLIFLAYAGSKAGSQILQAIASGEIVALVAIGLVVTSFAMFGTYLLVRHILHLGGTKLSGVIAGAQTNTAILAFAQERTGHDVRVALGYSLVYPTALVVKILLAQLLTLL
ncbi:aspartate:alanine exchanger family transporter [Microbacterium sp. bgisy207]|jgi:putative transport protein|uniref:aspartate:alanine exchanger family transporter n=1 Tax=Microbacterium sp. bgisy207 TaxID=3413800 RepID=UPI003EBF0502